MTLYLQQVRTLNNTIYPKDYLTEQVIRSKHFMEKHFSENLTLDDIASEVCLSKFHFVRLFKKYYGVTPYQYLTGVRMANAKEYLQMGFSVSETCYLLGFSSLSSFTAFFKRAGVLAPIEFQQKKATLKK